MSESRILLTGIETQGRHGANPGERDEPQPFVVDLDVTVDVGDDEIEATADYGVLASLARGAVEDESFELLETLAEAVARAVFGQPNVVHVVATVHKPAAAASLGVDDVAAEAIIA